MKNKRKSNAMDRISELPDEIIAMILSCLTMKQSASTSSISTRWRDLWKLTGEFDFDGTDPQNRRMGKHKFMNWVNQILGSHKGATIKRLRIKFNVFMDYHDQHVIDDWIRIASSKSVQCLELEYFGIYEQPFPFQCRFRSLTTLSFKRVAISSEMLESLLIDCPNLEEVKVGKSDLLKSLKLCSLSLKHLTLCFNNYCMGEYSWPVIYNISAPNLLSFTYARYSNHKISFVLEDVSQLKYLNINYNCDLRQFRNHLLQLQELIVLDRLIPPVRYDRVMDPEMPNLKSFTLIIRPFSYCLGDLFARLKDSPLLENLTLQLVSRRPVEIDWNKIQDCRFNNLKTVKFIGPVKKTDVKIMNYIASRAPLLEKIIIDPCLPWWLGTLEEVSKRQSRKYFEDRDHAINLTTDVSFNVIVL